jgi:hypothetical protein
LASQLRKSDSHAASFGPRFSTHLINIHRTEQYKKQFKKWNWSKYTPANEASWMENKAAKRKLEEKKDTIFEYRGQTYTTESLKKLCQRKKTQAEEVTISAGMVAIKPYVDFSLTNL